MFRFKNILLTVSGVLLSLLNSYSQDAEKVLKLAENGKSDYKIFINTESGISDSTPAMVFRKYFHKVTGISLLFTDKMNSKGKYVVFEEWTESNSQAGVPELNINGFQIDTRDGNLFFRAKNAYGLESAVYFFLEKYLDCRYYSPDCQVFPETGFIEIPKISFFSGTPFNFRTIHYRNAYDSAYARWHRLQNDKQPGVSNEWGMWVHTMEKLVPPEKYFSSHPEYFALRNGIRIKDQLCLSNPDVLAITIDSLRVRMEKNPSARYWSISQMDNYNYCQCDRCRMIDSMEGSPSGSIINFVNLVAMQFPDKVISTLAYQYSRKPPLFIRPAPNVNIMLCTIECDRSKPIENDTSAGSFYSDLKSWASISDNILVWDYVTNFSHLVAPFPNFHVLQPNILLFAGNHVSMMFEQGYNGAGGEFNELRCYLLSKLLSVPDLDVDKTMMDFLNGYYGAAAKFIYEYIKTQTLALQQSGKALTLYEPPAKHANGYLSPELIEKYFLLFDSAMAVIKDDTVLTKRVIMVLQSVRYAWLEVSKYQVFTDNWIFEKNESGRYVVKKRALEILDDFCSTANKYGPPILHETRLTPDEYGQKMKKYFNYAIVRNLAAGKKISFARPCSPQYSANGNGSLVDGVRGTEDYQLLWQGWWGDDMLATIDLENSQKISALEITCLDDNKSWIMAPASFRVEVSTDGKTFTQAAFLKNKQAGAQLPAQIIRFDLPFKTPVNARFIRVTVKNTGRLPDWRGVNRNAWIFLDEIVVK